MGVCACVCLRLGRNFPGQGPVIVSPSFFVGLLIVASLAPLGPWSDMGFATSNPLFQGLLHDTVVTGNHSSELL